MSHWSGPKVQLRAIEPEDAELFHRWNQDEGRARALEFLWPPTSLAATRSWVEEQAQNRMDDDGLVLVIEDARGEPVGSIRAFNCEPRNGTFSTGFDIARAHRRKGYAAAALMMMLGYYFNELRYQKVLNAVYDFNEASIKLHTRLGFVQEGRLRRMLFAQGRYFDKLLLGMTREEFEAMAP